MQDISLNPNFNKGWCEKTFFPAGVVGLNRAANEQTCCNSCNTAVHVRADQGPFYNRTGQHRDLYIIVLVNINLALIL